MWIIYGYGRRVVQSPCTFLGQLQKVHSPCTLPYHNPSRAPIQAATKSASATESKARAQPQPAAQPATSPPTAGHEEAPPLTSRVENISSVMTSLQAMYGVGRRG